MTRITRTLYNNGTLSSVHCYEAHSDTCLYDQIYQWRMRSKRTVRSRQPTERTAAIDFLVCSLRAVWLGYCYVVLAGAALAAVSCEAERDVVVGVEAWRRETKRTRGLKKNNHVVMNKKTKRKHELSRLDWNGRSSCSQVAREFERS
jgi:hypothetical protein